MLRQKSNAGMNLLFGILYLVMFLLSASVVPLLDQTSLGIKPDVLLAVCCVCSVYADRKASCVFAVLFGTLSDLFVTVPTHFSPLLFFVCALLIPVMIRNFSAPSGGGCTVCAIPFLLVRALTGSFYLLSRYADIRVHQMLTECIIPEFFCNVAAVIVVYYLSVLLIRLFRLNTY